MMILLAILTLLVTIGSFISHKQNAHTLKKLRERLAENEATLFGLTEAIKRTSKDVEVLFFRTEESKSKPVVDLAWKIVEKKPKKRKKK